MNEIKSTLPAKIGGTEITRFNALRHGCRFPPRFDPGFPLRTDPAG